MLLTHVFEYATGKKISDHCWIQIVPKVFPNGILDPQQFIIFDAQVIKYYKRNDMGGHDKSYSLGYGENYKPITKEELTVWKNEIKERRKLLK